MLLGSLAQLLFQMSQGTLSKYVYNLAAVVGDPVHGSASIDKAESLDPVDAACRSSPGANGTERVAFAF